LKFLTSWLAPIRYRRGDFESQLDATRRQVKIV